VFLVGQRQPACALIVEQHQFILILTESLMTDVADNSGIFFFRRLASPYSSRFSDSAAKPTQYGRFAKAGNGGENIGVCSNASDGASPVAFFLQFLRADIL